MHCWECLKTCGICEYWKKTNVLAGDETKHMVLFIFHALYTCLTAEDYERKKERKEKEMDPA